MSKKRRKHTTAFIYGIKVKGQDDYFYIGSTKNDPKKRLIAHLHEVRAGTHSNSHFANKVKKHGADNILLDVLHEVPESERWELERRLIIATGENLVNRVYKEFDPRKFMIDKQQDYLDKYEIDWDNPDVFWNRYEIAMKPKRKAYKQSDQWLHDLLHNEIQALFDCMLNDRADETLAIFGTYEEWKARQSLNLP